MIPLLTWTSFSPERKRLGTLRTDLRTCVFRQLARISCSRGYWQKFEIGSPVEIRHVWVYPVFGPTPLPRPIGFPYASKRAQAHGKARLFALSLSCTRAYFCDTSLLLCSTSIQWQFLCGMKKHSYGRSVSVLSNSLVLLIYTPVLIIILVVLWWSNK